MKRALKIFLWVIVCFAVITLSQAATFAGVWELEKTFLTGFWARRYCDGGGFADSKGFEEEKAEAAQR